MAEPLRESWYKDKNTLQTAVFIGCILALLIFVICNLAAPSSSQTKKDFEFRPRSPVAVGDENATTPSPSKNSYTITFKQRCNRTLQEEEEKEEQLKKEKEVLSESQNFPSNSTTKSERTMSQLSDTIIVDCPLNDSGENGHGLDVLAFIITLKARLMKTNNSQSLKIWLKYGESDLEQHKDEMNTTLCNELATTGNQIFPDTFVGILGNYSAVIRPAVLDKHNGVQNQEFLERQQIRGEEYLKFINDSFRSKGLKYGFLLDPLICFMFPGLTPKNAILEFNELFFVQKENQVYFSLKDNFLICIDWDIYEECKDFVGGKVPESKSVKRVLETDYMSFEEFVRVFEI